MSKVSSEIEDNYRAFSKKMSAEIESNIKTFKNKAQLVESYARVASLNGIKCDLVRDRFPPGAAQFFYEAHNDALLSHVNASFGSWRTALQCLRSLMENTFASIYYSDHPVELEKWKQGDFAISPRELREYVVDHPKVTALAAKIKLKQSIDTEYATLSRAVHGSSIQFRMTEETGKTSITKVDDAGLGKWSARERSSINICVTLMVAIFREHLDGAKLTELRKAMSWAVSSPNRDAIKTICEITIPAP